MVKMVKSAIVAADDKEQISKISNILTELDFSVITSQNTLNAILKLLNNKVHLLIIDINNRIEEKIEAIEIVKKLRPRLPIVVFINDNGIDVIRELAEAGAFYVANRTVGKEKLGDILQAVNKYHEIKDNIERENYDKIVVKNIKKKKLSPVI